MCSQQNHKTPSRLWFRPSFCSTLKKPRNFQKRKTSEGIFRNFKTSEDTLLVPGGKDSIVVMRILAARLAPYLCRWRNPVNAQSRNFCSSFRGRDERSIEEEAERKIGLLFKVIFAGTATVVAYQFFPYMGDNLMQQSVSLLQVKDPLFKRMGASRLARFAIDDEKRMKIVEMGGAKELLNMLGTAKDDQTRKEALRALDAISKSDEAIWSLRQAGAISVIRSIPDSSEDVEVEKYKLSLLNRFEDI